MINAMDSLNKELYFCRYLNKDNIRYKSIVSGRFILIFTISGTAHFMLNGVPYDVDSSKFLLLHPHVESRIVSASEGFNAYCIGSVMELQGSVTYNIPPAFLALLLQRPLWDMDEETQKAVSAFCTLFDYNYKHVTVPNSANIAGALMTVFIHTFYEKTKHAMPLPESEVVSVITRNLITRFMTTLRMNYKSSHQVTYYAEKLCVSSKYLTHVIKRSLGLTPKEIVDRKLAVESMYLLGKSDMSIQEISNELGFPDQSYFGRFFKRMIGMSPMSFRRNPDMRLMSRLKPMKHADMGKVVR